MLNKEQSAGTIAEQSTNDEMNNVSPAIGNTTVVCSIRYPWDLPKDLNAKPTILSDRFCTVNEQINSICRSATMIKSEWEKKEIVKMLQSTIEYYSGLIVNK